MTVDPDQEEMARVELLDGTIIGLGHDLMNGPAGKARAKRVWVSEEFYAYLKERFGE